jgi:hypothetical protein
MKTFLSSSSMEHLTTKSMAMAKKKLGGMMLVLHVGQGKLLQQGRRNQELKSLMKANYQTQSSLSRILNAQRRHRRSIVKIRPTG